MICTNQSIVDDVRLRLTMTNGSRLLVDYQLADKYAQTRSVHMMHFGYLLDVLVTIYTWLTDEKQSKKHSTCGVQVVTSYNNSNHGYDQVTQ